VKKPIKPGLLQWPNLFRSKLFPVLIVIVFLATGVIISLLVMRIYRTSTKIYISMMKLEADSVEKNFSSFFRPVFSNLAVIRQLGEEQLISLRDEEGINAHLMPILMCFPELSSIMIANSEGSEYSIYRDSPHLDGSHPESSWITGSVKKSKGGTETRWRCWANAHRIIGDWEKGQDYVPWLYKWSLTEGPDNDGIFIVGPQPLYYPEEQGLTIATTWNDRGKVKYTAAVNLLSSTLSQAMLGEDVKAYRKVFLVTDDERIIDVRLSATDGGSTVKDSREPRGRDKVAVDALSAWRNAGKKTMMPLKFSSGAITCYCEFRSLRGGREPLWMGVILSERYLLGDVRKEAYSLIGASMIVFFAGLLFIIFLIKRYRKLAALEEKRPHIPVAEKDILALIKGGESASLEFKSSLRWDYANSKVNSKLEEVILKTLAAFSNGDGGMLMIGVNNEGEILGLESDYDTLKERNKDFFELHLRDLINSEYGLDYSTSNLNIAFPMVLGKEICIVEVIRGKKPLFTSIADKGGQKVEKFYVRCGNSSREIARPSEITQYIDKRFEKGPGN
jgi:hypothetical protein